ncbi:LLM class flavin-dependent oxidoreductase [Enemella sp. A6]|uniref:LLM class flavin-dependent oxidoreductase n=1 Tax=Enemella sp. A6 TaxID=3440152 RepID=UPI003EB9674B
MDVALTLPPQTELAQVAERAALAERLGVRVLHVPEMTHDSLMVAALAINATSELVVRTSMTLAFPRSPMITAYAAWDLARFSGHRFELGLASQVRGNIEGRFSVPWSEPVGWLDDYLVALRKIFTAFALGTGLEHHGPHYTFTRLQPAFTPAPLLGDPPKVCLGAVGPKMVTLAGRRADRLVTHATNSHPRYLEEVITPALTAGAGELGRPVPPVTVVPMCITAADADDLPEARRRTQEQLAFLLTTPNYQHTLRILGLAEVGERLTAAARDQHWTRLVNELDDDTLHALLPEATWAELPEVLRRWYGPWADQISLPWPDGDPDRFRAEVVEPLQAGSVEGRR